MGISDAMLACCQLSRSTVDVMQRGIETAHTGTVMADSDPSRSAEGLANVESGMAQAEEAMRVMSASLSCMGPPP